MLIFNAILGLIFTEISNKLERFFFQCVTHLASKFTGYIWGQFRLENVKEKLTQVLNDILNDRLEVNLMAFMAVLEAQMGNDEFFASQLRDLIEQFESLKVNDQDMPIDSKTAGNLNRESPVGKEDRR